ncbi:hypothetical protein OIU84_018393 [Salix udensis]|uniref:Pectinesterase n=1 Tax=Salix udensis TaxID=889485 RepID=A0AAD6KWM2_9ROSI|nr:hypothetical protein OIU84_018393 [Salix udensis]
MAFTDHDGSNDRKKKFAIIGVSSVILVAMVVAVAVGIGGSHGDSKPESSPKGQISTSSKSIKAICQPTDYRETCEESLSKAAGNTTDPSKLVQTGFKVAIEALQNAINRSATLKELAKDPMASQALDNCRELMDDAIAELEHSFNQIESFQVSQFDEYVNNLKVWLSATITYQRTCLDGFENTTGPAGEKMKEILVASSQLTSNGLAMVDGITSILKDLNIPGMRRLLEADNELPSWVTAGKRKLLLGETPATIKADAIVAQDGSGQYKTIAEAIENIPRKKNETFVLYIKEGVYKEKVSLSKSHTHVLMIGDGPTKTKITGNLNYADGVQTFKTATVSIAGDHFMAKDIGFENSAGAIGHQAVALRVQADMSVFYNCQIDGYQDTLYAHTKRQFYRDCTISGTIDFIFGDAVALFQNCKAGRQEATGQPAVHRHSSGKERDALMNKAYLGRPWREQSRTIVLESHIDDLIAPEGWLPWMGSFGLNTLFYSEYGNRGPGAVETSRVKWAGIRKLTPEAADGYTAAKFIQGDEWIPQTGVPYTAGMINV